MIDRHTSGRVNVITHIHTDASNAEASELDSIGRAIRGVVGEDSGMSWSECFTPVERLLRLLREGRTLRGPVHLCIVTDHMRRRSHRFPLSHLAAAAADHRLALGAEIRTRAIDVDGKYRQAPEIIVYGGAQPVEGPYGPYYGVSTTLLEELWDTCLDDERQELCTRRAHALLLKRGIAHGLSHPFDGHEQSLEGTFRLISEFSYIEVVNGGYFEPGARVLDAYVRFHNAIVSGASVPDEILTDTGRRLVRHIRARGRALCPLSGADAHSHDFDRVVLSYALPPGKTERTVRPGDLFATLLAEEEIAGPRPLAPERVRLAPHDHPLTAAPRFANLGKPASQFRQMADILIIIGRNLWMDVPYFTPTVFAKTVGITVTVTSAELKKRKLQREQLQRALRDDFNPERLLPYLTYAEAPALRPALRVAGAQLGL